MIPAPVGEAVERSAPLFAADIASDGRPALRWLGHGFMTLPEGCAADRLADFINRIVEMERSAALRPAAGSADGLAEVEAKLRMYGAANRAEARAEERGEVTEAERADRHGRRLQREILDAVARLPAPAGAASRAVPEGYALVPVEPTEEMCVELFGSRQILRGRWQNMLAAAPKAPPPPPRRGARRGSGCRRTCGTGSRKPSRSPTKPIARWLRVSAHGTKACATWPCGSPIGSAPASLPPPPKPRARAAPTPPPDISGEHHACYHCC